MSSDHHFFVRLLVAEMCMNENRNRISDDVVGRPTSGSGKMTSSPVALIPLRVSSSYVASITLTPPEPDIERLMFLTLGSRDSEG